MFHLPFPHCRTLWFDGVGHALTPEKLAVCWTYGTVNIQLSLAKQRLTFAEWKTRTTASSKMLFHSGAQRALIEILARHNQSRARWHPPQEASPQAHTATPE